MNIPNWLYKLLPFAPRPEPLRSLENGPMWVGVDLGKPGGDETVYAVRDPLTGETRTAGSIEELLSQLSGARDDHKTSMDDDQFHELVWLKFAHAIHHGEIDANYNASVQFRLSYVCSHCSEIHVQHGDLYQIFNTFQALIQQGYPSLKIENRAFADLAVENGTENDPVASATNYRAFLDATRT